MKYNIIPVQTPKETDARLYTYILDNFEEIDSNRTRPLVLICPGGGYEFTSDREAEAVAVQYIARGFHACVLRYSVAPAEFPQSLCELAWSVAYLREHAKEYGIKPDKIIVSGFSAGVIWQQVLGSSGIRTGLQKKQDLPQSRCDQMDYCFLIR